MNTLTIGNTARTLRLGAQHKWRQVPTSVNGIPGPQIYSINGVVR